MRSWSWKPAACTTVLAAAALLQAAPVVRGAPIEFPREEVTLAVADSVARVLGRYWFRNRTPHEQRLPIVFPFDMEAGAGFPHRVVAVLEEAGGDDTLQVTLLPGRGAARFVVPVAARDSVCVRVEYDQPVRPGRAGYILTTARTWERSFESAVYRFVIPDDLRVVETWPPADSLTVEARRRILWTTKRGFVPERNMEIRWLP